MMNLTKIIELLSYTFPAVVTGLVAYYYFSLHIKNEQNRRRYLLSLDSKKQALPIRLQAYERMVLFLERITPCKLVTRVAPVSEIKDDYANFLIAHIEQEFDHNLAQQIYMSPDCWTMILTSKNATIKLIRVIMADPRVENANKLQEIILTELTDKDSPINATILFIKKEIGQEFY